MTLANLVAGASLPQQYCWSYFASWLLRVVLWEEVGGGRADDVRMLTNCASEVSRNAQPCDLKRTEEKKCLLSSVLGIVHTISRCLAKSTLYLPS